MKVIRPDWPAPDWVIALSTTRQNGHCRGVYSGANIARHVGDASAAVDLNWRELDDELPEGTTIQWLSQEHGDTVVCANNRGETPPADGSWSKTPGIACAVMSADCLPILLCTRNDGVDQPPVVAAVHAGWRGLARGVVEACVANMAIEPNRLMAWLGPAIGPNRFEVGREVRACFLSSSPSAQCALVSLCFTEIAARPGFFLADLYALARIRLRGAGVSDIYGGQYCTFTDDARFYSYRRDGQTGRMATVITLKPYLK